METHLGDLDPNGALGKITLLARKWEARARRAEARSRGFALAWLAIGAAFGVVAARVLG